jgi:hypothetical protein
MVWVYEDPSFTKRELHAHKALRRKLKDPEFVDKLIKLISLYLYLKRKNPKTVQEIKESAYFDKAHERPIFDTRTAKKFLKSIHQKGGTDSKYPYTDTLVKGILRDYTPEFIGGPIGSVYGTATGFVETIKNDIPFGDLASEVIHGVTELGVTSANDLGEVIGGPIGAVAVAPFTAVAAGLAAGLSTIEGDVGGAVAHIANWVPAIGIILNKGLVQTERLSRVMKKHPTVAAYVPYMIESHQKEMLEEAPPVPVTAGKRLSTIRRRHNKWLKTQRKKSATR